jgi:hypothetical protein
MAHQCGKVVGSSGVWGGWTAAGWRLTGAAAARRLSGDEGVVQAAREGSLGQGGASGPARGGVEAVSQAAHGGPWRRCLPERTGGGSGSADKKQGEGFLL